MPKNSLITKGTIYAKCYDGLRGVDFSSDHTQVADRRFAYLCNMWKDYKSAQGNGVETIPGFRKLAAGSGEVFGIHEYNYLVGGVAKQDVFVHIDDDLYKWNNFPDTQGSYEEIPLTLPSSPSQTVDTTNIFEDLRVDAYDIDSISYAGYDIAFTADAVQYDNSTHTYYITIDVSSSYVSGGETVTVRGMKWPAFSGAGLVAMAKKKSVSFQFNNKLYILDGTHFWVYDGTNWKDIETDAYVPTVYINGLMSGENATPGAEYEQRNMLSPLFKQTFIGDGTSKEFSVCVSSLESIQSIKVYGEEYVNDRIKFVRTDYTAACLRGAFNIGSGESVDGRYKAVFNSETEHWTLYKYNNGTWSVAPNEYMRNVSAAELGITVDQTIRFKTSPSFVTVNQVAWDFSSARAINGLFVYQCCNNTVGSSKWREFPNGQVQDIDLEEYGVRFGGTEWWFSTYDTDPEHNLLYIERDGAPAEFEFFAVTVDGETSYMSYDTDKVSFNLETGLITFVVAPNAPENQPMECIPYDTEVRYYPKGYAGIEIIAEKTVSSVLGLVDTTVDVPNIIKGCTMVCIYDGRVFLSGNPKYPNNVFWCGRNADTGLVDPSYWGLLNYVSDGVEAIPIKAMLPVADTLAVIKGNTKQDGSVFYHTPYETGKDVVPITYPSKQGLAGTGCIGAAVNFFDDPVFVSEYGLEGIGQLSVRLERALEHRSTLVDAKLTNQDLTKAQLTVWEGYLLLSIGDVVFMADSRQAYANDQGVKSYEWYYLEGLDEYVGQTDEYRYATSEEWNEHVKEGYENNPTVTWTDSDAHSHTLDLEAATDVYDTSLYRSVDLSGQKVPVDMTINSATISVYNVYGVLETKTIHYVVLAFQPDYNTGDSPDLGEITYHAYYVVPTGAKTGGTKKASVLLANIGGRLLFGTENGSIFCFNTDKRNADGSIDAKWYSFDGRTIECGCATKMDNCGIPHLTKTTVKKSIVIKTKNYDVSAAKIKVRTNRNVFNQVARINSMMLDFEKMDFTDFSMSASDKDLFAIKEKERRWVEKQYYVYSDEYCRPFALYYLAYRYYIIGRYKNR